MGKLARNCQSRAAGRGCDVKRITIQNYLRNPTPERYAQLVEQVAKGIMTCWPGTVLHDIWRKEARAALRAIGITPPRAGGKGAK